MSMDVNLCKPCAFLFRVTAMMHLFFRRNHIPCLGKKTFCDTFTSKMSKN